MVKRRYWRLDWSEKNHFLVSSCLLPLSSVSEWTRRDLRGQEGKRGVGWWFGWACFVIVGTRGGGCQHIVLKLFEKDFLFVRLVCAVCCLVLSCVVLSCVVLSCFVLFCFVLSCLVLSCLVLSCLISLLFSSVLFCSLLFSSSRRAGTDRPQGSP